MIALVYNESYFFSKIALYNEVEHILLLNPSLF